MKTGKWLGPLFGASLGALFSWLMVRHGSLDDLARAFAGAGAMWIAAAAVWLAVAYACRVERWRAMLQQDSPGLSWTACIGPLLAGFAANNVLPLRAGDVLRCLAFNRQLGATYGVTVATLLVERLLDLLTLTILLGLVLALFDLDAFRFTRVGGTALITGAGAVLIALFWPHFFAPPALAIATLVQRLSPRLGVKLSDEIERSFATLRHLARGKTMPKLVLWSLLVWCAEGCAFWLAALALPSIAVPSGGWLACPVGALATLIPSTPGYIGTFDYFTARAMSELGNTMTAATAYALLVHALLWLPPTILGGLYFLMHSVRQPKGSQASRS